MCVLRRPGALTASRALFSRAPPASPSPLPRSRVANLGPNPRPRRIHNLTTNNQKKQKTKKDYAEQQERIARQAAAVLEDIASLKLERERARTEARLSFPVPFFLP